MIGDCSFLLKKKSVSCGNSKKQELLQLPESKSFLSKEKYELV